MSDNAITLDDIFALFRESEQQRQEYQHQAELEMAELRKTIEQTNKQIEQTNKQTSRGTNQPMGRICWKSNQTCRC